MMKSLKSPEHYRLRAAECRKLARLASDQSAREEYEDLAARYEEIATTEEKLQELEQRMKKDA